MYPKNPSFKQRARSNDQCSVLDGRDHIRGLPSEKQSPVEEARRHPEQTRGCKSVLDGPACIIGLPPHQGA